jgi:hypothetical protein
MASVEMVVELAEPWPNFRSGHAYDVFALAGEKALLVNDDGRFVWVPADKLAPISIVRGDRKVFDREEYLLTRRYEQYINQEVLLTTWEDLGLPLHHRTEESMLVYRVTVEGFDGKMLMVRGGEGYTERSGVLATQIYKVDRLAPESVSAPH